MSRAVYYVPGLEHDHLAEGSTLEFGGDEARHAGTVKRTRLGEQIELVNGHGMRVLLEVSNVEKSSVQGIVRAVCHEDPHTTRVTLIQALAKGGRDEQAIETATEYGVDAVMPWQADRSVARWEGAAKIAKGCARWESTVQAAAKQSRRSYFPAVLPFAHSGDLAAWIADAAAAGTHVYVCHESAQTKLVDFLADQGSADIALIVGPEGGICDEEIAQFEQAGASTVLLGEHVMRASSAGAWAIAVIRAQGGIT